MKSLHGRPVRAPRERERERGHYRLTRLGGGAVEISNLDGSVPRVGAHRPINEFSEEVSNRSEFTDLNYTEAEYIHFADLLLILLIRIRIRELYAFDSSHFD
jgi:hypothetical protein